MKDRRPFTTTFSIEFIGELDDVVQLRKTGKKNPPFSKRRCAGTFLNDTLVEHVHRCRMALRSAQHLQTVAFLVEDLAAAQLVAIATHQFPQVSAARCSDRSTFLDRRLSGVHRALTPRSPIDEDDPSRRFAAPQENSSCASFDHLVGLGHDQRRKGEAERLGCLEI